MRYALRVSLIAALLLTLITGVTAQDAPADTTPVRSGVEITWPPPVTEVWSIGDVLGTASVENLTYFYLEYVELNADLTVPENAPWIPATAAQTVPVIDGTLATLDTTIVPDGLYALRLVVVTSDQQSYSDTVMPIRVNNERMGAYTERVIADTLEAAGIAPTAETPTPTPEPPVSTAPMAYPALGYYAVNVRFCDSIDNNGCPVVDSMDSRGGAVLAYSASGTGWYNVILPSGMSGWVSPTVIRVEGDISSLPFVAPPAPLPPPAVASIVLNGINIQGGTATCGVPFSVEINVANIGSATAAAATVTLQDVNISTGEITATQYGGFPALNPGSNYVVVIPMSVTAYYNENHELRASLGTEGIRLQYFLNQGGCNVVPPTPPPTATPIQEIMFNTNQCFIVLTEPWPAFSAPYDEMLTQLAARAWEARSLRILNGERWYSLYAADLGVVWVTRVDRLTQGNCGPAAR